MLELDPGSSKDLVRRQYIRLVKKHHPDTNQGDQTKFHEIDEVSEHVRLLKICQRNETDNSYFKVLLQ